MRTARPLLALTLLGSLLPGCASSMQAGHDKDHRQYTFVFLRTGPATGLTPEQQQTAFQGHFSNMQRMADADQLLIAGPFGEPKSDPAHRGLWVFNTPSEVQALEWGKTDPAVEMGVFELTAHPFTTDAPLDTLYQLEKADEARRLADPDLPDEWQGRSYVLATHPWSASLRDRAANAEGVIFSARLHATGEDGADQIIAWLDATTLDAARAILPEAESWTLHGWYGTKVIGQMPRGD